VRTRLLSAAILVPLVVAAVWVGQIAWGALLAVAAVLAANEGLRLVRATGREPTLQVSLALAPALALTGLLPHEDAVRPVLALAVVAAMGAQVARSRDRRSTDDLAATLAWPIYVGILMSYAVLVRGLPAGLAWTVLLLVLVWANDSFAYLGGRAFGRTPFFHSVSPRKTLEGALIGGAATIVAALAAPAVVGFILDTFSPEGSASLKPLAEASPLLLGALGLAVATLAPLGDLAKSVVKRQAGVKDSGELIPGHGGVLDRMDSLMFAAPVVYYAARLIHLGAG
jgi:phosphatidate cytidylyltransferase